MSKSILSKRKIAVSSNCKQLQVEKASGILEATSGIENVLFDTIENNLSVDYNSVKIIYSDIENTLNDLQVNRTNGIKQRLLSIWYDYLDTTARDNALAPPAACCNKPPRRH